MIAVYVADSLQAQIVRALCAAHRIDAVMLDAKVKLARHLSDLKAKEVRLTMLVVELGCLQDNQWSILQLRGELKASGVRGKVALLLPNRIAIDPLIERWASVDQGALMTIPAMNLGLRETSIFPVAQEIAGVLGCEFESRRSNQFLHGLNATAFVNHPLARLHRETERLADEGILMSDMLDWLDECDELDVQTRQYRLTSYEDCVLGSDLVAALVERWQVSDERAIEIGNWMIDAGYLYHVLREHYLVNEAYFYRLCWPSERLKGIRLGKAFARMAGSSGGVSLTQRSNRTRRSNDAFTGADAVDWLRSNLDIDRSEAITCGQTLFNLGMIRHVTEEHEFLDQDQVYRFEHVESPVNAPATLPGTLVV